MKNTTIQKGTIKSMYWSRDNNKLTNYIEFEIDNKMYSFGGFDLDHNDKCFLWIDTLMKALTLSAFEENALKERDIDVKFEVFQYHKNVIAIGKVENNIWLNQDDFI